MQASCMIGSLPSDDCVLASLSSVEILPCHYSVLQVMVRIHTYYSSDALTGNLTYQREHYVTYCHGNAS